MTTGRINQIAIVSKRAFSSPLLEGERTGPPAVARAIVKSRARALDSSNQTMVRRPREAFAWSNLNRAITMSILNFTTYRTNAGHLVRDDGGRRQMRGLLGLSLIR